MATHPFIKDTFKWFTTRRLSALLAAAVSFLPLGSLAQGVDFMVMVDQYGQNVVNTLHTEIMNDAGRNAMRQSTGKSRSAPTPTPAWPRHITANHVGNHVFTVEELGAMHGNDRDRTKRMLDGRAITVSGRVSIQERDRDNGSSFRLKSNSGQGYDVWVYYGNARRPASLRDGSHISIQGVAEAERRGYLTLRSPKAIGSTTLGTPSFTAGDVPSKLTASDNEDLSFSRSTALTKKLNERLATSLAPLLKKGNTKQHLLDILNRGELQRQFEKIMVAHGFSPQDLGDVVAASIILNWQVANRHDHDPPRAGIQAVRDDIHGALTARGNLTQLTDPQKQTFAEFVSTTSLIIASRYRHGKESQDSATVAQASDDARDLAKALLGMDLRRFALTNGGFVDK